MRALVFSLSLLAATADSGGESSQKEQERALETGKLVRCPVCQGMPIAESPSEMAQAMMRQVRDMQDQGKSQQEVLDYFASRYGEWVLLKPKARGFAWLVWLLPPVFLLAGIFWIRRLARSSVKERPVKHGEKSGADASTLALVRKATESDDV